jgi:hypothetical protein
VVAGVQGKVVALEVSKKVIGELFLTPMPTAPAVHLRCAEARARLPIIASTTRRARTGDITLAITHLSTSPDPISLALHQKYFYPTNDALCRTTCPPPNQPPVFTQHHRLSSPLELSNA